MIAIDNHAVRNIAIYEPTRRSIIIMPCVEIAMILISSTTIHS